MANILCIDYGAEHVGIAYAITPIAEPYQTVRLNQALSTIDQLIKQHHINTIVFGLSEGAMAQETRDYAKKVAEETGLPIVFHDETLSSQDTRHKMAKGGAKKKKREAKIDHYVAAAILQDYLDSQ